MGGVVGVKTSPKSNNVVGLPKFFTNQKILEPLDYVEGYKQ